MMFSEFETDTTSCSHRSRRKVEKSILTYDLLTAEAKLENVECYDDGVFIYFDEDDGPLLERKIPHAKIHTLR